MKMVFRISLPEEVLNDENDAYRNKLMISAHSASNLHRPNPVAYCRASLIPRKVLQ